MTLTDAERLGYATAEPEERYRIASTARTKMPWSRSILDRHPGEPTLVIGAYLEQLEELGEELRGADHPGLDHEPPSGSGSTTRSAAARSACWWCPRWPTSPSTCRRPPSPSRSPGTFGSRQEEAQRLGRLLRPKDDGRQAHFYSVVARDTLDTDYAAHRQRFLAEQGYAYRIVDADDLLGPAVPDVG